MRRRLILLLFAVIAWAAVDVRAESEREACQRLADKYQARVEVTLPDRTRVDLLSADYAIEVDWANKWYEAVGQSVWYSIQTARPPAIILLVVDRRKDQVHLEHCQKVCDKLGIRLFTEQASPDPTRARNRRRTI